MLLSLAGAVVALALVTGLATSAGTARADSAAPNVLNAPAQAAWGWIADEAQTFLQTQGLSSDTNNAYSRQLIGSYILLRLDGIINSTHRTAQEQAAYDYLKTQVIQEEYWTALNAQRANQFFDESQLNCGPAGTPLATLPAWGLGCIFSRALGAHPGIQQYNAEGFAETFSSLNTGDPARFLADTLQGVSYWGGLTSSSLPSLPDSTDSAAADIEQIFQGNQQNAVSEILNDVTQALISRVLFQELPDPQDWAIMGAMLGVIVTDAVWNQYDSVQVDQGLASQVDAMNPANNPNPDLSALTTPSGLFELGYVVTSQLLPPANFQTHECSFNTGYVCDGYMFSSDPAYEGSLYTTSQPPAQTPDDPFFEVTGPGGVKSFSSSLETGGAVMPGWPLVDQNGDVVNGDATSARGLSTIYDPHAGLISSIHNGMVVTSQAGAGRAIQDNTWLYRHGLEYTDQSGNIWRAWYQNGSFLQIRVANALGGIVQSGLESGNSGAGIGCNETPLYLNLGPGMTYSDSVTGNDCLFSLAGHDAKFGGLAPGDEVSFLGQTSTVDHVTNCYQSSGAAGVPCTTYGPTAVVLQPGASDTPVTTAFDPATYFAGLFLNFNAFPFSGEDDHAYQIVHLDTCAGRSCAPGAISSDLANCSRTVLNSAKVDCFRSPTISYQALVPTGTANYTARLIQPPVANPDSYRAYPNDGVSKCCTATSLTVTAANGLLANDSGTDVNPNAANGDTQWDPKDVQVSIVSGPGHGKVTSANGFSGGSFTYTPNAGFGWLAPAQDQFTYKVCHAHFPASTRACATSTATITVRNAEPKVDSITIRANTSPSVGIGSVLYVNGYSYSDREGDPQGASTFAWFRSGQATGVTGPSYVLGAGDAGKTITVVVTPAAVTGSSPGLPTRSAGFVVPLGLSPTSYTAQPTSQTVVCTPRALTYLTGNPTAPTTCVASVSVNTTVSTVALTGTASFRSIGTGAFDNKTCTLAKRQVSRSGLTFVVTEQCSVKYTPGAVGAQTVIAGLQLTLGGGWGTSKTYPSSNIVVTGPPKTLELTGLQQTTAYTPQKVTVRVLDASGVPVEGYRGTIHFTSSDALASLPSDYTFKPADAGTHSFNNGVTLKTENFDTVTVSAPGLTSGTQTVFADAGPATHLKVTLSPGSDVAGTPQRIIVDALDAHGNQDRNYTGTEHFTSSDPQAVLPDAVTFTPSDAGEITVSGLVLKTAGLDTVTATDSSFMASGQATITPASASQLEVDAPASATAGNAFDVTVKALDQYGNVANGVLNGYQGTVDFSSSDNQAGLPNDYTFTPDDAGVHTFAGGVILTAAGSQTVTATDTGDSSITGSASVSVTGSTVHKAPLTYELMNGTTTSWSGQCLALSSNNAITFNTSGPAEEDYFYSPGNTAPYPGTFTASGSLTLDANAGELTTFDETFTINATDGTTITGTITLDSPGGSAASCDGYDFAYLDYQATIVTADGTTCSDSGNPTLDFNITLNDYFYEPLYSNFTSLSCTPGGSASKPSLSSTFGSPLAAWIEPVKRWLWGRPSRP